MQRPLVGAGGKAAGMDEPCVGARAGSGKVLEQGQQLSSGARGREPLGVPPTSTAAVASVRLA